MQKLVIKTAASYTHFIYAHAGFKSQGYNSYRVPKTLVTTYQERSWNVALAYLVEGRSEFDPARTISSAIRFVIVMVQATVHNHSHYNSQA